MATPAWMFIVALAALSPDSSELGPESIPPSPTDPATEPAGEAEAEAPAPDTAPEPAAASVPVPAPESSAQPQGDAPLEPAPQPVAVPEPEPGIEFAAPESDPFVEPEPPAAEQAPPPQPPKKGGPQPPVFGPLLITGGLGLSSSSFGLGVGATGFPIPYIGIGLDIDDTIFFGGDLFNEFTATPHVWVLATPYHSITPFVRGGFGVDVFSSGLGVYAIWKAAAGIILRLGKTRRFSIRGGVEVIGRVSDEKFSENFVCGLVDNPCSLRLRPELGFGLRFGGPR